MENYWIERAEKAFETAQQIEMFTRRGVAKELDGVIDDLNDYDCNGNEATPTKLCIETLEKLLETLKSVDRDSAFCRKELDQAIAEAKADEEADEEADEKEDEVTE